MSDDLFETETARFASPPQQTLPSVAALSILQGRYARRRQQGRPLRRSL
jgi:hypothetical protein